MITTAKSPRVILVHGFNVRDGGAGSIGKLSPFFERAGFEVVVFNYGWRGLLGVRFGNKGVAKKLTSLVRMGDVVVGHSNGACVAHLAATLFAAPFGPCVYINPALDADALLAPQVPALDVWYSPDDGPVAFAKFLPWHPWGDMGARGYQGNYDPRIHNHNKSDNLPVESNEHSDTFAEPALSYFAPQIVATTQLRLIECEDPATAPHIKKHFDKLHHK